jgi:hypothetical protein
MEIGMAEIELQWSAGKSKLTAEVLLFVLNNEPLSLGVQILHRSQVISSPVTPLGGDKSLLTPFPESTVKHSLTTYLYFHTISRVHLRYLLSRLSFKVQIIDMFHVSIWRMMLSSVCLSAANYCSKLLVIFSA